MERLIIMENGDETVLNVTTRVVTIGRSSKNDISIKDRNASRRHCNIIKVGDSWFVVDCDSQNGTFVNGKQIKKQELEDGDKITVGAAEIVFLVAENSAAKVDGPEPPAPKVESPTPQVEPPTPKVEPPTPKKAENIPVAPEKNDMAEKKAVAKDDNEEDSATPLPRPSPPSAPAITPPHLKNDDEPRPSKKVTSALAQVKKTVDNREDESVRQLVSHYQSFHKKFTQRIVGREKVAKLLFISLLTNGHTILSGESGTGKHSVVKTLTDILGISLKKCPLEDYENIRVGHVVLVDQFQQTPAKKQLEFTEAIQIQEDKLRQAQQPGLFTVVAVSNHVLSEAASISKDSFMFEIPFGFLSIAEESKILQMAMNPASSEEALPFLRNLGNFHDLLKQVTISPEITEYVAKLLYHTRPHKDNKFEFVQKHVRSGASPQSGIMLLKAAKAAALIEGRKAVQQSDIKDLAKYTLYHHIQLRDSAKEAKINVYDIVKLLLNQIGK